MSDERKTVQYQRGVRDASGKDGDATVPYDRKGKLGQRVSGMRDAPTPNRATPQELTERAVPRRADGSAEPDCVVGWLVVERGIGRGKSFPLFSHRNAVGRGSDQDVALTFPYGEDASISRAEHCFIGFEPKKNVFIAEKGAGGNYTYVNGDVLLNDCILKPFDRIEVGATTLVFVPLSGPNFQWQDDSQLQK